MTSPGDPNGERPRVGWQRFAVWIVVAAIAVWLIVTGISGVIAKGG